MAGLGDLVNSISSRNRQTDSVSTFCVDQVAKAKSDMQLLYEKEIEELNQQIKELKLKMNSNSCS